MAGRIRTALLVLALGTVAAVGAAAPASAAGRDGRCERSAGYGAGELCVFQHPGLRGGMLDYATDDPNWGDDHFFGTTIPVAGNVSSLRNMDLLCAVVLYQHANFKGAAYVVQRGRVLLTLPAGARFLSHRWIC
jgi:hypothetical protein